MKRWFWESCVEPLVSYLTPSCKDVTRLLSGSLERPLPFWRRAQLQLHFIICDWCHLYGQQLILIRALLHRFHTHVEEDSLSEQARKRIAEKLQAEEGR